MQNYKTNNCLNCKEDYLYRVSQKTKGTKYCSIKCQYEGSRTSVSTKCLICKKNFMVQPHRFKNNRGKYCSPVCTKKGIFTTAVRKVMSDHKKGKPNPNIAGNKCHFWKGGICDVNKAIRNSLEYRLWRTAIFTRDNFTCIFCKQKGGKLQADHIKPFAQYPELRFAIDNGRTLCEPCHKQTDTYGGKINSIPFMGKIK